MSGNLVAAADLIPMHDAPTFASRLGRLFDLAHQRLFRLGCRMTGDPDAALDLVQEAFLRAASRPAALPGDDPALEAWLVRVLVNLCHDRYRKSEVRMRLEDRVREEGAPPDPEAAAVARDLARAALASLPPQRRAIVVLHEMEELSVREIARLLRLTEVTVRWHLAKGRREMAVRLAREIPAEGDER